MSATEEKYTMPAGLMNVATQVESQALNAVVAGFSFAAAIAWMDVVRFLISTLVVINKNNPNYYVLSALFTTVLAVVVYLVIKNVARNVSIASPQAVYAVTRA
jgi:membrane protein YdbS with pleckstrin-like domain